MPHHAEHGSTTFKQLVHTLACLSALKSVQHNGRQREPGRHNVPECGVGGSRGLRGTRERSGGEVSGAGGR